MTREQASDPNTPPSDLLRLAPVFMAEVLENPALPLLLLENPSLSLFLHYLRCVHQNKTNGWAGLSASERDDWLQLSYERHFGVERFVNARPRRTMRATDEAFVLEGDFIDGYEAFFCGIGEAINGAGGYFGRNFNAFDDCCRGGFGLEPPATIVWLSYQRSIEAIRSDNPEWVEYIDASFAENNITIEER